MYAREREEDVTSEGHILWTGVQKFFQSVIQLEMMVMVTAAGGKVALALLCLSLESPGLV